MSLADMLAYWGLACGPHEFLATSWSSGHSFDGPDGTIWLLCRKCGVQGVVTEFSEEERLAVRDACGEPVPWPGEERVEVTGYVDDLTPYERVMVRSVN